MESSVHIWMKETGQEVDASFVFNDSESLSFDDFLDACRRAALAFGYAAPTVEYFFDK